MKCLFRFLSVILTIVIFVSDQKAHAQNISADSLELQLKNAKEDSNKVILLNKLFQQYDRTDTAKALAYCNEALILAEKLKDKSGMANTLQSFAIYYTSRGNYEKALEYLERAKKLCIETNNLKSLAKTYGNTGRIYLLLGKFDQAMQNNLLCLKTFEELKDDFGIELILNNIGNLYRDQNNDEKALEYYNRSIAKYDELPDSMQKSKTVKNAYGQELANIGITYKRKGNYDLAIVYYLKVLEINKETGDKKGMMASLNNLGSVYGKKEEYKKALKYFQQSLDLSKELGDKQVISINLRNIGLIYDKTGNLHSAVDYVTQGLEMSREINYKKGVMEGYQNLADIYSANNHYKEAFNNYLLYSGVKDSMLNEDNGRSIAEMNTKYETEKKEKEIVLQKAEIEKKDIESKKQKILTWSVIGGLLLVIVFSVFMFNRWRVTQRQKTVIQRQKILVDEKNKHLEEAKTVIENTNHVLKEKNTEILASISYAQRIQEAILPPTKLVKQYLQDSFVLYKPKDIVAGDFYWMEVVGEKILFAACDCTGHGVPGAFVSIVGHNGLNRAVKEFGLIEPAKILDKVNSLVEETFSKSEQDIKDGMDIALCGLTNENGKWTLEYSGANNSIYHIRGGNINEIKADKQPIGKYAMRKPFTNNVIELQSNDSFYAFSDGYPDQFGGPKGKKFKYSQFENLLVSIQEKSMTEQREILNDTIEKWKGTLEQIDDICIIGVRV